MRILKESLSALNRYKEGKLTLRGLRWFGACLKNRIHGMARLHKIHTGNEWLAKFLFNHLEVWFLFLRLADLVEATNNVAEKALGFNIAARKL